MTGLSASKQLWWVLGFVLLLSLGVNMVIFGIYDWDLDDPFSRGLASAIGLPAAIVNGRFVPLRNFYERSDMVMDLRQVGGSNSGISSQDLLTDLVREELVRELAARNQITVSSTQLALYAEYLTRSIAGGGDLQKFGLSADQFMNDFALPDYLKSLVAIRYLLEHGGKTAEEAQEARVQIVSGTMTFADAATKYSDDEASKYLGGDIGFWEQTDLPPWEGTAVFGLDLGEVSEVVVSPDGYRIFTVTARDEDSNPPQLQVRQIFFADHSFDEFFEDYSSRQSVYFFRNL